MKPTKELADRLYMSKIEQARSMTPAQKFWAGARLFDFGCQITTAGIRDQFPDASPERVREILKERLALQRRLERGR